VYLQLQSKAKRRLDNANLIIIIKNTILLPSLEPDAQVFKATTTIKAMSRLQPPCSIGYLQASGFSGAKLPTQSSVCAATSWCRYEIGGMVTLAAGMGHRW
jgi:hypothetical protein